MYQKNKEECLPKRKEYVAVDFNSLSSGQNDLSTLTHGTKVLFYLISKLHSYPYRSRFTK